MNDDGQTRTANAIVLLTRLARAAFRASPEELLGIKLKELGALSYLREHGRVTQSALAAGMTIDSSACVLLLNDLETADRITRWRDPGDRRRHLVELTTRGEDALERAETAQATIEDEVLGGLSAEQRETLRELLAQALESTERASSRAEASTLSPAPGSKQG